MTKQNNKATQPLIQVKNLHKSFGNNKILNGVDLSLEKGQSLVILGNSGGGKSVTLRSMLGLNDIDQGSIIIDGVDIHNDHNSKINDVLGQMAMLFQSAALFDSLNVWENITFKLLEMGMSRDEARMIAAKKISQVGLSEHVLELMPSELSGGMKKRVSLARTICDDPKIIFFDEPTTGLDPITANIINDLIVRVVKEIGASAITITHNIASARQIADKVALLYQGKVVWYDEIKKLDANDNKYINQFIQGDINGPIKLNF